MLLSYVSDKQLHCSEYPLIYYICPPTYVRCDGNGKLIINILHFLSECNMALYAMQRQVKRMHIHVSY